MVIRDERQGRAGQGRREREEERGKGRDVKESR